VKITLDGKNKKTHLCSPQTKKRREMKRGSGDKFLEVLKSKFEE
jgi:hypothetical protein